MPTVLALETSCDESAAAVVRDGVVLSSEVASQVAEHALWGGVVPELASRRHVEAIPHLVESALVKAGVCLTQLDGVAATVAPGLLGALMVGSVTARSLAQLAGLPFIGIHHLEGHLCSALSGDPAPKAPLMVLLVSGGHTELIALRAFGQYERLAGSRDDAAGEAFDKVARLLGLPYPGGPALEIAAKRGDPMRFRFPPGRISLPDGGTHPYDFSFSGLKTAVQREVQRWQNFGHGLPVADLAASFQQVVCKVLVERSVRCAVDQGLSGLVVVGGVSANGELRRQLVEACELAGPELHLAPMAWCTDNAAMIGLAACKRLHQGQISQFNLGVAARWPLAKAGELYGKAPF
jgi:N6-L-threonylcarbamoyladenine synthase